MQRRATQGVQWGWAKSWNMDGCPSPFPFSIIPQVCAALYSSQLERKERDKGGQAIPCKEWLWTSIHIPSSATPSCKGGWDMYTLARQSLPSTRGHDCLIKREKDTMIIPWHKWTVWKIQIPLECTSYTKPPVMQYKGELCKSNFYKDFKDGKDVGRFVVQIKLQLGHGTPTSGWTE